MSPLTTSCFLLAVILLQFSGGCDGKVVMCYYAEWAVYRTSPGTFFPRNIEPELCTHLVYAYLGMDASTFEVVSRDPWGDYNVNGKGLIFETLELRKAAPHLKVLASIGGWSEGSVKFSEMASSPASRAKFVTSVYEYLLKHGFDGVDMAWEYPADRGGVPRDKANYATLLKELREKLNTRELLLTIQLYHKRYIVDPGYDVRSIASSVDYISLVLYQYHSPGEKITAVNAPLHSDDDDNVERSIDYMLKKGAPKEKLLMGLASYGHQFMMDADPGKGPYLGKPASTTYEGPWSKEAGFIGFNEVCYEVTGGNGWVEHWDHKSRTPFAVNGRKFMSYDNVRSFKEKLALGKRKGLAGAFLWSIDTDDFKGLCYDESYPLLREINRAFDDDQTSPELDIRKPESPEDRANVTVISHEYGR